MARPARPLSEAEQAAERKAWNERLKADGLGVVKSSSEDEPELPRRQPNARERFAEEVVGVPATFDWRRSGAPPGRPRRGTKDPDAAAQLLEELAALTIERLRSSLGRGRKSEEDRTAYDALTRALAELMDQHRATSEALAKALRCNPSTVRRAAAVGREQVAA